jgi:hypothetical protein
LTKRVRMFLFASRGHDVNVRNILGFIILSYACHIIGFASYIRYFAGWSKENYLCQGQRD